MHVNILEHKGRKTFAVLPYAEFLRMQEELEDLDDLRALRAAKAREAGKPTLSVTEVKRRLGLRVGATPTPRR
jgi:hypothetical protein